MEFLGYFLHFAPDAEEVAAPELADLFFGVASAHQFESYVEGFGGAVPAVDAAATVEVGRDADVVDADEFHGVVDVVDEVVHVGATGSGEFGVDGGELFIVVGATFR